MKESDNHELNYCYFSVRWLDMWGGDLDEEVGNMSIDEALVSLKIKINYNEAFCGTTYEEGE